MVIIDEHGICQCDQSMSIKFNAPEIPRYTNGQRIIIVETYYK